MQKTKDTTPLSNFAQARLAAMRAVHAQECAEVRIEYTPNERTIRFLVAAETLETATTQGA